MPWRGPFRFQPALPALGLLTLITGCGGGGSDVGPRLTPAAITVVAGNQQTGRAGAVLPAGLAVKVTASSGAAVEGASVTFAAAGNSGSVSSASTVTSADGNASTTWTLGTTAGSNVDTVRANVSGVSAPAVFIATVVAGDVAGLTSVSGNSQNGIAGQPLAQPLVVVAQDQFGNSVGQVTVAWTVSSGGGTISPASSLTGTDGLASASWTPGNGGTNTAQAAVPGVGTPVSFSASIVPPSGVVTLTSLSPTPLVEGQTATLTGTGFSLSASRNRVKIGDLSANVTASTATTLTVTVPKFNCQPARGVPVQVTVGSDASNVFTQPLNPASLISVAVGQQLLLQDPAEFCLQFGASTSAEDYLIGVQSTSEVVTSLTPATLTAVAATSAAGSPLLLLADQSRSSTGMNPGASAKRWAKHYSAESDLRNLERRQFGPRLSGVAAPVKSTASARASFSIPPNLAVGDTVPIRFPDIVGGNLCNFLPISTVVRVIGSRGIWLEDVGNPVGGYTTAEFQSLSDQLDHPIYDTDVGYFGAPSDIDNNGRIVVVITKEVNKKDGLGGFVTDADLVPRSSCAASEEAEMFYGLAPSAADKASTLQDFPRLIGHEFSHIIQFSRRMALNAPNMAGWTAEGQATLAEEVVGFAVEGKTPGQNYGFDVAFNNDDPASEDWYSDRFFFLAFYFGFDGSDTKVAKAPEQCTWLGGPPENSGPCFLPDFQFYGPSWALLRWLSDQYGPAFAGGEKGLQKALIDNQSVGYDNIANVIKLPIKSILAQWAAMLYTDDRVPTLDRKLTLASWNLFEIFDVAGRESVRLVPRSRAFGNFADAFSVRAGSSAYFRVSGATHAATAVRVRNGSDGPLPSIMQVFVVRLQ